MGRLQSPPFKLVDLYNEDGYLFVDSFDGTPTIPLQFDELKHAPVRNAGYDYVNAELLSNLLRMNFNHGNNGFSLFSVLRNPVYEMTGGADGLFGHKIMMTGTNGGLCWVDLDTDISTANFIQGGASAPGNIVPNVIKYGDYYYFCDYQSGTAKLMRWKEGEYVATTINSSTGYFYNMALNIDYPYDTFNLLIVDGTYLYTYDLVTGGLAHNTVSGKWDTWGKIYPLADKTELLTWDVDGSFIAFGHGVCWAFDGGSLSQLVNYSANHKFYCAKKKGRSAYAWGTYSNNPRVVRWDYDDPTSVTELAAVTAGETIQAACIFGDSYFFLTSIDVGGTDYWRLHRYDIPTNTVVKLYSGDGYSGVAAGDTQVDVSTNLIGTHAMFVLHDKIHIIAGGYFNGHGSTPDYAGCIWQYNGPASKSNGGGGMSLVRRMAPQHYQDGFWDYQHRFKCLLKYVGGTDSLSAQIGFGALPFEIKCNVGSNTEKHVHFKIIQDSSNTLARGIYGSVGNGTEERIVALNASLPAVDAVQEYEIVYDPLANTVKFLIDETDVGSIENFGPSGDCGTYDRFMLSIGARSWGDMTAMDILQVKHYIE